MEREVVPDFVENEGGPPCRCDGVEVAEHCTVIGLGVDGEGRKHPLRIWEGSTEHKTVCKALLTNPVKRGLDSVPASGSSAHASLTGPPPRRRWRRSLPPH